MLSAAGSLWCCRHHSTAQPEPQRCPEHFASVGSSQSGAATVSDPGTPKQHWKERKGLPCPLPRAFPGSFPRCTNTSQVPFVCRGYSFSKRKNSLLRSGGKKKQKLSILPIPVFLAEVGELFGHAGIYSANTCISIFMTGGFLMPASSFKAMGAVMIPTELSLGAEQELDFLLLYVTLGRHTACLESLWSLPGFRPRALRSQSSG